jgi:tetratricopeptide (TPR) repeat protein
VLTFQLDFSTPALTAALSQDAADPSVPLPERMANLMQLAALDFSHQRHADAQEKYSVLHEYYAEPHQPGMQALCLLGSGDSLDATGEPAKAKQLYELGINLCLAHDAKLPLLHLLLAVVRVSAKLGLNNQAELYAHSGFTIALALVNGPVYVLLAEMKADAQLAQGKRDEALATYDYARKLAETYSVYAIWKSVLEKLEAEQQRVGRDDLASDMRREWQRADALERSGGSGGKPALPPSPQEQHAHA